mmetsp:Transcript_116102/g.275896  ORF Transcript_116102/g.275896 Transcript_116102/m.275896 type:complete len:234 (-) Transcript_116102:5-706(-)
MLLGTKNVLLLEEVIHVIGEILRLVILDLAKGVVMTRTPPVVAGILQKLRHCDGVVNPVGHLEVLLLLVPREVHVTNKDRVVQVLAGILDGCVHVRDALIHVVVGLFFRRGHGRDPLLEEPLHLIAHEVGLRFHCLLGGAILRRLLRLLLRKLVLFLDGIQLPGPLLQLIVEGDLALLQPVQLLALPRNVGLELLDLIPLLCQIRLPLIRHGLRLWARSEGRGNRRSANVSLC